MRADFSRFSFDNLRHYAKHYAGVLHQQGRVWLDSDWNEDVLTRLRRLEEETCDLVGACGVPDPWTAFRVRPNPDPTSAPDDFLIDGGEGPLGRFYVDGILCHLGQPTSYLRQPDLPDPPRVPLPAISSPPVGSPPRSEVTAVVYLEVWRRLITYLEDESLREIALGGPDTTTRLKTVAQVKVAVIPAGTEATCASGALFVPRPGSGTLTTLQPKDTQPPDLCRLPDPANYTGRENRLYRVEIHDAGDVLGAGTGFTSRTRLGADAAAGAVALSLAQVLSADQVDALKRAGIVTVADDDGGVETLPLADVLPDRRTLRLGRGLGRAFTTARNAAVTGGAARFKWSRDNASFAVAVMAVAADRQKLTLKSLGRDQATALRQGDVVEISDDASELGPGRGHLTTLTADPDPDQLTVSLADRLPDNFGVARGAVNLPASPLTSPPSPPGPPPAPAHLILRRWDGLGWASATFDDQLTPDMNLGDGVHIQVGGSDLRVGDYWQFAARSADGSVEALTAAPPAGVIRHRCPLAIVRWSRQAGRLVLSVVEDCRKKFPPLTRLTHLYYVSGDSQEALLGQTLPQPLQVGVANGLWPVAGAKVRFRVIAGTGTLRGDSPPGAGRDLIVLTGDDGVAQCTWQLDATTASQRVEATLAGAPLPVRFNATFRDAGGQEPGVRIKSVIVRGADGRDVPLPNDTDLPAAVLAQGIRVVCDRPIFQNAVVGKPTCYVTLDMPFPFNDVDRQLWGPPVIGFQPLILAGRPTSDNEVIFWNPTRETAEWLRNRLTQMMNQLNRGSRVLAHLTLKGNFIWADDNPDLFLDGDVFGFERDEGNTDLRLPSGDSRRGGDFEMWFWVVPGQGLLLVPPLTLAPDAVIGTTPARGIVTLSSPAPAPEGVQVNLSSSSTDIARVPPNVTVRAGQTTAEFPIQTFAVGGSPEITASLGGGTPLRAVLRSVVLADLTVVPDEVVLVGGPNAQGQVFLSGPAPAGGVVVTLRSDKPVVATVPPDIRIEQGQNQSQPFVVQKRGVGQARITASLAGVDRTEVLTVVRFPNF
jgi:hypothetical protein